MLLLSSSLLFELIVVVKCCWMWTKCSTIGWMRGLACLSFAPALGEVIILMEQQGHIDERDGATRL